MIPEMSNKQLTRLTQDAVNAVFDYRRQMKKIDGKTPSINSAINQLIVIGWDKAKSDEIERKAARAKAGEEAK